MDPTYAAIRICRYLYLDTGLPDVVSYRQDYSSRNDQELVDWEGVDGYTHYI